MLASNVKGVKNGYPLRIEATTVETKTADFNPEFLKRMFPKLEWKAFCEASAALGEKGLPAQVSPETLEDEEFLKAFHHSLLELHVEEGALICPETGRKFPVNKGIPNMLLNEDEC
eukprot:CAMPEP_0196570856 /NCGR_PEP_ID=MMETSP1081-20130531/1035_1 /TAXON_ID=36882 /ORGANISM="Pyramimonas amylifera, Strain CCMP720" /LENGTH=115 /DNA_ID=CAMNT_0041887537 /DNA_START=194 /DNA_END=541 /DNA_ORIENTATION=+